MRLPRAITLVAARILTIVNNGAESNEFLRVGLTPAGVA